MKYLIIGTGATGSVVGTHLIKAGKDVTFIARGKTLEALKNDGLRILKPSEDLVVKPVSVYSMEEYDEMPDVIFVCVKGYSVGDTIPFIKRIAGSDTVVIPILNIYTTGENMQRELPELLVTDGCIYVAAEVTEPGTVVMRGDILRVVYGVRNKEEHRPILETVYDDLNESGILGILSENIRRDALLKFSYVSAQSACGVYYDIPAGPMQKAGEVRDCFASLVAEIGLLAKAMGVEFEEDIVARNLKILDDLAPESTTSMQRDLDAGKASEIDGQIFEVVRTARGYGLELPTYEKIAESLRERV